ncbi:MAG: cupin domain-containing protein [Cyclobacteriaceae bacterium]|nr:cupin domain-containing protein [Cyclobacteriaceae bacterium]
MYENAQNLITKLHLKPHPEGGWYREVYRSNEWINAESISPRFNRKRCFSTGIYYMLCGKEFSAWHRIQSDELWHHYQGCGIVLHIIDPEGQYTHVEIGNIHSENPAFQIAVPAQYWFAVETKDKNSFFLSGCTVAPGFDFADFEFAQFAKLSIEFPQHKEILQKFCIR